MDKHIHCDEVCVFVTQRGNTVDNVIRNSLLAFPLLFSYKYFVSLVEPCL